MGCTLLRVSNLRHKQKWLAFLGCPKSFKVRRKTGRSTAACGAPTRGSPLPSSLQNRLVTGPITVMPILFMADGTEYDLASMNIPPFKQLLPAGSHSRRKPCRWPHNASQMLDLGTLIGRALSAGEAGGLRVQFTGLV